MSAHLLKLGKIVRAVLCNCGLVVRPVLLAFDPVPKAVLKQGHCIHIAMNHRIRHVIVAKLAQGKSVVIVGDQRVGDVSVTLLRDSKGVVMAIDCQRGVVSTTDLPERCALGPAEGKTRCRQGRPAVAVPRHGQREDIAVSMLLRGPQVIVRAVLHQGHGVRLTALGDAVNLARKTISPRHVVRGRDHVVRPGLQSCGLDAPDFRWSDSVQIARRAWPDLKGNGGHGLGNLKKVLRLDFHHHDAGEDARAAAMVVLLAEARLGHPFDSVVALSGRTPAVSGSCFSASTTCKPV